MAGREGEFVRTRLYLCRHGEVVGDGRRRYNGHRDVDITENGVAQMERLAGLLSDAPLSAIYSSDLIRAMKGAEIIGVGHDAARVSLPAFRERNVGAWEGMAFDEIEACCPADWRAWLSDVAGFAPPGGESVRAVSERVLPALADVIRLNRGRDIVLVAHGGVNRVILSHAMGLELSNIFHIEQNYGALNVIDYYEDGMSVVKLLNG
jgi:alpha-ribazole phosphatase